MSFVDEEKGDDDDEEVEMVETDVVEVAAGAVPRSNEVGKFPVFTRDTLPHGFNVLLVGSFTAAVVVLEVLLVVREAEEDEGEEDGFVEDVAKEAAM